MAILTVGERFPEFDLVALKGGDLHEVDATSPEDYFENVSLEKYEGKWKVVFFYPKDFTFVCPTEIAAFGKLNEEFEDRDTQVLGGSTDNEYSHFNWRATHPDLKTVPFPMFADVRHDLIRALGVENEAGVADRATFIIDPDGVIQFVSVTPDAVGRNVEEVLRVLDALQSEEVCACDWQKNDPTKNIDKLAVVQESLK
ncbi:alkyl hydroperoxide reductase [Corynebacterium sp. NML98-0116]|uniref:Alkyl hydroperoxide reductase C n=1 Tax=Corynebacterium pseudogenitalium TaxID=38303 RepID=A0ABD4TPF2_9CORY|nr:MULTISPECIES: peroxiredoxin [Corynebacterium]AOX05476.1 alkyl hydroperoxide reductase [Corynebacterium sp. NML98-0116]MCQ4609053.1 peroxiredoxin [Corynebacterium sp. CCUG 61414]MCQ4613334.1 peroxiredoxin [Corynebacterium pseudogenitalium]MDK8243785.1 peroxiredoxin [Corynebacterium sp. UMB10321]UUA86446.1 peroxiredoxin [Corynebacterium pseudogenitalium]